MTDATVGTKPRARTPFRFSSRTQRNIAIVAFLIVPVVSLVLFNIYPVLQLFWISLTDFNSISWSHAKFVGLTNFINLVGRDQRLLAPMVNSLYYLGGSLGQIPLAPWFAVTLNQKLPGSQLFRTILFLPFVLNAVAAALIFRHVLQLDGTLNDLLVAMFGPGAK